MAAPWILWFFLNPSTWEVRFEPYPGSLKPGQFSRNIEEVVSMGEFELSAREMTVTARNSISYKDKGPKWKKLKLIKQPFTTWYKATTLARSCYSQRPQSVIQRPCFLRKTLTFLLQLPATSGSPGAAFARGVSSSVVLQPLVGRTDSFLRGLLPTTCHSETTGRPGFLLGLWLNSTCGQCLSVCIDVGIILNMYADYHRFTSRCAVVLLWHIGCLSSGAYNRVGCFCHGTLCWCLTNCKCWNFLWGLLVYILHAHANIYYHICEWLFFQHFHRSSNWTIVFGALSLLSWHQYIIFNSLHYPFWILLGFFSFDSF